MFPLQISNIMLWKLFLRDFSVVSQRLKNQSFASNEWMCLKKSQGLVKFYLSPLGIFWNDQLNYCTKYNQFYYFRRIFSFRIQRIMFKLIGNLCLVFIFILLNKCYSDRTIIALVIALRKLIDTLFVA